MSNQSQITDQRSFHQGFHLVGGNEDTRSTDIKNPGPTSENVDRVGGCEDSRNSNVEKVTEPPADNPRG
jgi:hypothetical protein